MKSPLTTDLTPEQRALLMLRLRRQAAEKGEEGPPPIPRALREGDLPLSFSQERCGSSTGSSPATRRTTFRSPYASRARSTSPRSAGR